MAAYVEPEEGAVAPKYNENLRADVATSVSAGAPKASVHRSEWAKVMAGARSARPGVHTARMRACACARSACMRACVACVWGRDETMRVRLCVCRRAG